MTRHRWIYKLLFHPDIMNKKYKINFIIHNQQGAAAILLTLLILSTMLFVALTASSIIQNGLQMSRAHINSTKAYYGAEAGVERMLWEIRKNGHDPISDLWVNDNCVHFTISGDIHSSPTALCSSSNVHQTLAYNGVKYLVHYHFDVNTPSPPDNTVKLKSVGVYNNITKRAVEISYID